jgi:hypothetical protein
VKVLGGWSDGPVRADLARNDLLVINNALNEILHGPDAIDEVEFHTRIGVTRGEAERLLDEVGRALDPPPT